MIKIKSDTEIQYLKDAGIKLGRVFDKLKDHIVVGVSTLDLDSLAYRYIKEEGCKPSFLGYEGFPGTICASVNSVLIHGIPSKDTILNEGDIISIDMGLIDKTGFQADAARTFYVGNKENMPKEIEEFIKTTEDCFYKACSVVKPGIHVTDISAMIEKTAKEKNYSLVEEFGGHGIGREMHEDPMIPNCGKSGYGPIIKKNMALAIEPMLLQGSKHIIIEDDGWTVKSKDNKLTCHYENTIIVTENGFEITTVDSNVLSHIGGIKNV